MENFVIFLRCSYAIILHSLRNHSAEERRKALSSWISHITVVILFFGLCTFMYTCPASTFSLHKMIAVFYTIEMALINILIYILRNAEFKKCHENVVEQEIILT
jgi:olfactory receptor